MRHLYNVYGPLILESGEVLGPPRRTACMSVEQLEALDVKGLYGNGPDRDDDTDSTTLAPGSGATPELQQPPGSPIRGESLPIASVRHEGVAVLESTVPSYRGESIARQAIDRHYQECGCCALRVLASRERRCG